MIGFLAGMVTLGYLVAAAFFLRFYRKTRDRLFGAFALAFVLFAANQSAAYFIGVVDEATSAVYGLRLIGFALILWAIFDKNLFKRRH